MFPWGQPLAASSPSIHWVPLNASLAVLVDSLRDKGTSEFEILHKYVYSPTLLDMLVRKGVFPYTYLDYVEKLWVSHLPEKNFFFNDLIEQHISDADYEFAQTEWNELVCDTLKDYLEGYLAADVFLLEDVFEKFQTKCLDQYALDPANYLSSACVLLHPGNEATQLVVIVLHKQTCGRHFDHLFC